MSEFDVKNEKARIHCEEIANCVNEYVGTIAIECGYPPITTDYVQGFKAGTIDCDENEQGGFNYYFFTVSERGCVTKVDFLKRWLPFYRKWYGDVVTCEAFIHFLISRAKKVAYGFDKKFTIHNGHVVDVQLCENNKYRLSLLRTFNTNMGYDMALSDVGYEEPIYDQITCPICGAAFYYTDHHFPDGASYEVQCPNSECGMLMKRKKI